MKPDSVLKEVLKKVNPKEEDLKKIENALAVFIKKIEQRIKKLRINAEVFVGGSFAKKTIIQKNMYDIDIFIRFDKENKKQNISDITKKILKGLKFVVLKGSRNYFRVKMGKNFFFEIIPVMNVKGPKEAKNITDLSYSHVNYINRKVKSKKILDDIKIAKAFCYANHCYGAESYINGFSGYGLELLVYNYKGFLNFIKKVSKLKDKEVIDIEKYHKNKKEVLLNLNSAKLQSPIVLVDPTYKHRNVLAALSQETFERFGEVCREFLQKPDIKFFEIQKKDIKKIKTNAKKRNYEFVLFEISTIKQAGDIAATKLLKFQKHLAYEISKYFEIKDKGFNYNRKKAARCFFVVKKKKQVVIRGPLAKQDKNVKKFKKKHRDIFKKLGRVYARKKIDFTLRQFIDSWKKKYKKKLKDMSISGLRVI